MLKITIKATEGFDEATSTFVDIEPAVVVELEHSLLSLSKWESKFQKPFLSEAKKSKEELFGYLQAMVLTPDVDPDVLFRCSQEEIDEIQAYIDSPQSATTFGQMPERRGQGEVITSELIYYWMVQFSIPVEFEKWHLNRLFALIRIYNIKNSPQKKIPKHELAMRNRKINEERRKALGTKG
jgi:hypothetical protein